MMTSTRITAIVFGAVAAGIGFLTFVMGTPPDQYRGADGYYVDDPVTLDRPSRAIVTNDTEILKGVYTDLADDSFVLYITADPIDLRIQGAASGPTSLFMGVAATNAVNEYLMGAAYDEVIELDRDEESKQILEVQYTAHAGTGTLNLPSTETFWETSVEGTGLKTLDWTLEPGDWTAVIMNADASSGVTADVAFGAAAAANVDAIGRATSTVAVIALIGGALLLAYGLLRQD